MIFPTKNGNPGPQYIASFLLSEIIKEKRRELECCEKELGEAIDTQEALSVRRGALEELIKRLERA